MELINLTPHVIFLPGKTISKSGIVAGIKEINGIMSESLLRKDDLSYVENIPKPKDETIYIVSMPTLLALRASGDAREDVYCPITRGEGVLKNEAGQIIQSPGLRTF